MLQPLFYKEGDDNYETMFPVRHTIDLVLVVIFINWIVLSVTACLSGNDRTVTEVKEQLNRAEQHNQQATTITDSVTTGLQETSTDLRESATILASSSSQLASLTTVLADSGSKVEEVRTGLQHLYLGAKQSEDDLARADALVKESIRLLQEVEKQEQAL